MKCIAFVILLLLPSFVLYPEEVNEILDDYYNLDIDSEPLVIYGVPESGQDMSSMNKNDILSLNPDSLSDILKRGFNLSINSNGGTGNQQSVNIRGLSGSRVLILLNGVPVNSPQSGDFDLSTIDAASIERIEVIEGGSDTKYAYSGAMGGVINIITRSKRKSGFSIWGETSNRFYYPGFYYPGRGNITGEKTFSKWHDFFDTQFVNTGFSVSGKTVSYDLSASFNRAANNYIFRDGYNVKRRLIGNEILDFNVSNGVVFDLPHYMNLEFSGSFYYADRNISGSINSTNPGKQSDYKGNGQVSYKADFVGTDRIFTEFIASYNHSTMEWEDNYGYSKHILNSMFAVNRWGFIITDWAVLNTGGDFSIDFIDSNEVGSLYVINGGGYLSAEFNIHKKIKMIPFVKVVYGKHYPVAIPKFSFVYNINENVNFKSNVFRVFRVPSINDLYWPDSNYAKGNPDLNFEDGAGGDVIVEYVNKVLFDVKSSFYVNYIKDVIQWANNGGQWIPDNTGSAFFIGSSHSVKTNFSKYFYFNASYEFLMSFLLSNDLDFKDDKRMPYKPVHTFGFGVTGDWQSGKIVLSGNYQSERYTNRLNAGFLQPVFTLDLDISQNVGDFTVYVSFKNMLNLHYYLIEAYPMPNGSVTVGLRYRFIS